LILIVNEELSMNKNNNNPATLASQDLLNATLQALQAKNIQPTVVKTAAEALEKIKGLIPAGKSVMNGSSITLKQIGFTDLLKSGKHPWNNLHAAILAEKDAAKQAELRKQSVLSDFYLGSVHALTKDAEFIIASNSGSQLPHVVFTSPNLIFVVSSKKIVNSLDDAMNRLDNVVVPQENARLMEVYGVETSLNQIFIFKNENPMMNRNIQMIIVEEDLGF